MHPDIFAWLKSSNSAKHLLGQLDKTFEQHLCADLDSLIQFAGDSRIKGALRALKFLEKQIHQGTSFCEGNTQFI